MSKVIIGLVGQIASGKEITKKYIIQKYGAESVKFSQIVRDMLARIDTPATRENMSALSLGLRQIFGEDIFAKAIINDVNSFHSDIVIVDGVRRMEDIEFLKDLPQFALVSVDATPENRYERMKARNENPGDAEKTFEEFLQQQLLETEMTIAHVMSEAQYQITNNGTLDELHAQTDKLITDLMSRDKV